MSIDTKLVEALDALQPTAATILKNRPMPFEDGSYPGFQPLLDEPMRQVLRVYEGSNHFLRDQRSNKSWTPRQSRAVANILRSALRGESTSRDVECYKCGEKFPDFPTLMSHKKHSCSGRKGDLAAPQGQPQSFQPPQTTVPVLPDYQPKHNIDLTAFPPGRFAVLDDKGNDRFIIITELKRRTRLAGRFVWTKFRYANEYLDKGDRTVREQIGDTKKLIGKQTKAMDVYHGEEEDLILAISQNPSLAMMEYGRKLHKCAYCGRSLTDFESRLRGIGPDCWEQKHVPYLSRSTFTSAAKGGATS